MKAWTARRAEDYAGVVAYAETRGKAKAWAAGEMECESIDIVSVIRSPHFDEYFPDMPPAKVLFESGWRHDCLGCGAEIYNDDGKAVFDGYRAWCSAKCRKRAGR